MSEYTNQIACRVALVIIICINNTQCHSWGNSMNIKRLKETGCFFDRSKIKIKVMKNE